MADGQKPQDFINPSILVATLVAAGSIVFTREAPLEGSRPAIQEQQFHEAGSMQDVEARLWQDPFAAVAKFREKLAQDPSEFEDPDHRHAQSPLTKDDTRNNTSILVVTIPGAPYFESAEWRRRTRYAVLAGLMERGYVPLDAEHIGYFFLERKIGAYLPRLATERHLRDQPIVIPLEHLRHGKEDKRVLVLWVNEDLLGEKPIAQFETLLDALPIPNIYGFRVRIIGPTLSDTLYRMVKEARGPTPETYKKLEKIQFYSYAATAEAQQLDCFTNNDCSDPLYKNCIINVDEYFRRRGINLYRTVTSDDFISKSILEELKYRGIEPGRSILPRWIPGSFQQPIIETSKNWGLREPGKHNLALISEQDTFYGRTFPSTLKQELGDCTSAGDSCWIHTLTYLRGLDGTLPSDEAKKKSKSDEQADRRNGNALAKSQTDVKAFDRPFGQSQQDYLRRLADKLRAIDRDLALKGKGRITAIGILGSDVFDKLLILRALQPNFPRALFFTSDFDAALMTPSELRWTRNLIIASSFGPDLRDEIQHSIPPFRSTYQTSAFLATLLAIEAESTSESNSKLGQWLPSDGARIFEVERTGHVLPFPSGKQPTEEEKKRRKEDKQNCDYRKVLKCNYIQPDDATMRLYPDWGDWSRIFLGGALAMISAVLIGIGIAHNAAEESSAQSQKGDSSTKNSNNASARIVRTKLSRKKICDRLAKGAPRALLIGLGFLVFLLALTCFLWPSIAEYLTDHGNGEPISLFRGVSLWPAISLRLLGIIFLVILIPYSWYKLEKNWWDNNHKFMKKRDPKFKGKGNWKLYSYRLNLESKGPYNVQVAWQSYHAKTSISSQAYRVFGYVAFWFIFVYLPLCTAFGCIFVHGRGLLVYFAFWVVTITYSALLLILIFLVFDATRLCWGFVKDLSREDTEWPPKTKEKYMGEIGFPNSSTTTSDDQDIFDTYFKSEVLDNWIDLYFIEERTKCLAYLIYAPFIMVSLFIVSRSNLFGVIVAGWATFIAEALCLFIVFGCAVALNWSAENARRIASRKFAEAALRAKSLGDGGRRADHLETMRQRIQAMDEGAFTSIWHQPYVGAALLVIASLGWAAFFEGSLPGF